MTHRLSKAKCPTCDKSLDAATKINALTDEVVHEPSAGDATICAYCGEIMEFGEDMELVILDPDTIRCPEGRFMLLKAQKVIRSGVRPCKLCDGARKVVSKHTRKRANCPMCDGKGAYRVS